MDSENFDFLGELMSNQDDGFRKIPVRIFLLLSPGELKACRGVCHKWDEFIKGMWRSIQGQKELTKKLENRWKTADPTDVAELRLELQEVYSIFTDDTHIFCGFNRRGNVAVYNLASGVLVKELAIQLTPGEVRPDRDPYTRLVGGDGILAAVMWGQVLHSVLIRHITI